MNKKILLALLTSAYAFAANPNTGSDADSDTSADAQAVVVGATEVRYDFDIILSDPNALNDFNPAQLIALQTQLTAAQMTTGQGFGAFDKKLTTLQDYVSQRLSGVDLAITVDAIPTVKLPRSGKVVIDMHLVKAANLLAAGPDTLTRFYAELTAQVKDKYSAYHLKGGNTKVKTDGWLGWLAKQGVTAPTA